MEISATGTLASNQRDHVGKDSCLLVIVGVSVGVD